ncbi:DNA-directed RNA polymerase I RPA12 [Besnoitia besnoiti]|uniref:DNA-directed RNA polymerase I subunit RPA12 n=1 Tax=Besnoitia besnoiti TaxID=94643 RepID=A0A2A9MNZ9_BESBE|nr:DNA-directed RNA polymerase I RPA12 [Besnoitia besnoiti]PFH38016.1 DNA-directed RNA polymerase I RPA12 [Besnoitia besnoiti]
MPRSSSRAPLSADALLLAQAAESLVVPVGAAPEAADSFLPSAPPTSACQRLLRQTPQSLDDSVEYFALSHRLGEDAQTLAGPPKFVYESPGLAFPSAAGGGRAGGMGASCSPGVSYDWLLALGCLNCGRPITVADDVLPALEEEFEAEPDCRRAAAAIVCRGCGHHVAPLHQARESDALVDCMQGGASAKGDAAGKQASGEEGVAGALKQDGIYVYGQRKQHRLGDFSKRWWQQRFLGAGFGERLLEQQLRLVQAFTGSKKGVICKETCEKCGHGEAFFSTFQARSADEGMTVMYECVKCGHRRVFNN